MGKFQFSLKKFLISNWFITLFSTMLGVFAGLYLSKYFEEKSFKAAQKEALLMIMEEVDNNHNLLIEYDSISQIKIEEVAYLFSKVKGPLDNSPIVINKDSLKTFKIRVKSLIDSVRAEPYGKNKDSVRIRGDANFGFQSNLILGELSTIAWDSYKQTNYLNITSFKCITNIELLYQIQEDFNRLNDEFKEQFLSYSWFKGEKEREEFLNQWLQVIQRGQILLSTYERSDDTLFIDCK